MATYKNIKGSTIQSLASDLPTSHAGEVWFNTTSGTFKSVVGAAAWSTGGVLPTPAAGSMAGMGTQTSALVCGSGTTTASTYSYDGSSWTVGGNLGTGRNLAAGAGASNSAAICIGGFLGPPSYATTTACEEYGGSSWTAAPANLNTGRKGSGAAGATSEDCWIATGITHPPSPGTLQPATETFNGTAWTTISATVDSARQYVAAAGTTTAAVIAGGQIPPPYTAYALCESFNGTAWSVANVLNQNRKFPRGNGTQTAAAAYGGNSAPPTSIYDDTELFDGTSWATSANMATPRDQFGSAVTAPQMTALAVGGETPSSTDATEELALSDTVETITST